MIKVVNIYKSFKDRLILNNINFEVNKGETLVIIGGSGSGKSTLLKAISGLNRQYKGEILIDGENILHLSRKNLAKKMAILPQGATTPTDLTVKELVSYGRFPYRSMFKSLNNKKEQEKAINQIKSYLQQIYDKLHDFFLFFGACGMMRKMSYGMIVKQLLNYSVMN